MATGSNSFGSSQSANGSEEKSILLDMTRRSDQSDQPCDITLVVKDGKEIKACGNVLREASSFVKNILDGDWKESREGIIRLEFLTEEVMKEILKFIYSGSVEVSSMETAQDLIAAADFLLLPNRLKDIAGQFCEQNLSNSDCITIYHYAERYQCEKLLAKTTEFIHSNFASVANAEEFLTLSSREVEQWISSDDINISAEDDVFRIILKWIDHDKNERKKNFQDLFRHVRLSFVSRDCLLNEVSTNELIKHDDTCLNVVMSILNGVTGSTTDGDLSLKDLKSPRNVFQTEALVVRGKDQEVFIYLPDDDEWYQLQLPGFPSWQGNRPWLLSSKDKLFFFYSLYHNLESYNASLNYWTTDLEFTGSTNPAEEEEKSFQYRTETISVVEDECFFLGHMYDVPGYNPDSHVYGLFKRKLDSTSWEMISFFDWGPKHKVCFVFADKFIYAIGGRTTNGDGKSCCAEATRFDTIEKMWEKIADIQDARYDACGVSVGDSIFIAGGKSRSPLYLLETCEMYNILTNEWQFIANLTIPRRLATMVCVDGKLYILGGFTEPSIRPAKIVECYDGERNEWKQKTTVPVSKRYYAVSRQNACSLRIFKGILSNLQSLQQSEAMQRQCNVVTQPVGDSFAAPVENVLQLQCNSVSSSEPEGNTVQLQCTVQSVNHSNLSTVKGTKKRRCCNLM